MHAPGIRNGSHSEQSYRAMERESSILPNRLFTASKHIIQDFASEKKVATTFIKDLIQKVLHHPDFDPDDVDHYMHV